MIATIFLLAAAAPMPGADALDPARAGKIRCIGPDTRARTCATMVRYTVHEDDRFEAVVTGVVSTEPMILIEYQTSGRIEDGAVCSTVRPVDFKSGKLSKDGAPLAPAVETSIRERLMLALQPLAGRKRCYRDKVDGDGIVSDIVIDGLVRADMNQRVLWVSPEDGWAPGM
ncbi:hypothetical protein JMG10_25725 [Nostoc ellipsosporum NOK]|uniref:hypothetical protein n=1 Tax=Sphingomonas sp. IBVSS2 TaxID=1985172 RepID=UPI000A2E1157|nr:hypothetical protein [Sphingomonas sp. IBVSS2]MDF2384898.1 hypothetical protein [Nostoc ellipsosporum NOK]OSZ66734.1 hypothetical protein CAP40_12845 [Sphingomonas sp. IBVSS2]